MNIYIYPSPSESQGSLMIRSHIDVGPKCVYTDAWLEGGSTEGPRHGSQPGVAKGCCKVLMHLCQAVKLCR
jgi:hypothetical protein